MALLPFSGTYRLLFCGLSNGQATDFCSRCMLLLRLHILEAGLFTRIRFGSRLGKSLATEPPYFAYVFICVKKTMKRIAILLSNLLCTSANCAAGGISLLQTQLRLGRTAPVLKPLGRSFFSENPANSANWWLRYTTAKPISGGETVGWSQSSESAAVLVDRTTQSGLEGVETLYFLKSADWQSSGKLGMKDFVQAANLSWRSVMERDRAYTPWVDFHDGHWVETLRFDRLEADLLPFQVYPLGFVGRGYVPHTTLTMEWLGPMRPHSEQYAKMVGFEQPDKCRDISKDRFPEVTFWKSTFAVLNASAAKDFAVDLLQAEEVAPNPFPWPRQPDCIAVQWVALPQAFGTFQLHFVEDFVYDTVLHGIPEYLQHQREFLKTGTTECINSFMLNNLILETSSLDPFARRLEELSVPYFAFEIKERYALLFSFPGNEGVTLQLQSAHLSHVVPRPVQICT